MSSTLPTVDRERMQQMYQHRWKIHGSSPLSLGWTKDKQDVRFEVLLSGLSCEGKSILDVGCGFGDLNRFLRRRTRKYTYHGIDLVPEFIDQARQSYGDHQASFEVGELSDLNIESNRFDVVVASGAFSYRLHEVDNYAYIKDALAELMRVSREAVSIDFLSDRVNHRKDHCFHANPERVLTLALDLTRNVRLRHDYMPFEFAVTLFKDDSFDEYDTLFKRHKHEITDY